MNFKEHLDLFMAEQIEEYKEALNIDSEETLSAILNKFEKDISIRLDLCDTEHYKELKYLYSLLKGIYTDRLVYRLLDKFDITGMYLSSSSTRSYTGFIPMEVLGYVNDKSNFPEKTEKGRMVFDRIHVISNDKKQNAFLHETVIKNAYEFKIILDEWDIDLYEKSLWKKIWSKMKRFF